MSDLHSFIDGHVRHAFPSTYKEEYFITGGLGAQLSKNPNLKGFLISHWNGKKLPESKQCSIFLRTDDLTSEEHALQRLQNVKETLANSIRMREAA